MYTAVSSMQTETETAADSTDMSECPHDDKPNYCSIHFDRLMDIDI